ncbi:unnamed protein product, partial [Brassica rapa]
ISEQLASAKHLGVLQVSLPANVQTEIEQIGEILNSSIAAITNSSNDIRDVLNSKGGAYHSFNPYAYLFTILGLVSSIFGIHLIVYTNNDPGMFFLYFL